MYKKSVNKNDAMLGMIHITLDYSTNYEGMLAFLATPRL